MKELGHADRCIWCNRADGELLDVRVMVPSRLGLGLREAVVRVHGAHESGARAFFSRLTTDGRRLMIGVAILLALTLMSTIEVLVLESRSATVSIVSAVLLGPALLGLAVWMGISPCVRPEAVVWLGIERAVVGVRVAAAVVAASAAWLTWLTVVAAW
jgi:hypothetical protein